MEESNKNYSKPKETWKDAEDETLLFKLRKAWFNSPNGAKQIVFEAGYTRQNVFDSLKNGRSEELLQKLIEVIKVASEKANKKISKKNEIVQSI